MTDDQKAARELRLHTAISNALWAVDDVNQVLDGPPVQAFTDKLAAQGCAVILTAERDALAERVAVLEGQGEPVAAWVLQRNDFPHTVYFDEGQARAECARRHAEEVIWREENRHVADVKTYWNVYKAINDTFAKAHPTPEALARADRAEALLHPKGWNGEAHRHPLVPTLREAVADGFTNGNEQYDDATDPQQHRYDMAVYAVIKKLAAMSPSPATQPGEGQ
jgi:hypothetical protein